jgi:hypothetical protein
MSGGGTPPRPLAPRPLYPRVDNPEDQRRMLADAEQSTQVRDAEMNAAEQRRLERNLKETLEDVLEREFKVMLSYPVGIEAPRAMKVSERTALLTAAVKLLAVKAKLGPKFGEGLDDSEDDE